MKTPVIRTAVWGLICVLLLALTGCAPASSPSSAVLPESSAVHDTTAAETPDSTAPTADAAPEDTAASEAEDPSVLPLSRQHYDKLDDTQRQLYSEMYAIVSAFAETGPLSPAPKEALDAAFLALCEDHPELFWLTSYSGSYTSLDDVVTSVEFRPGYSITAAEKPALTAALESRRDELLNAMNAELPADASDADRAYYLFNAIIQNTFYDQFTPADQLADQSAVSCLVDGWAVCAGYARALQYLLMSADIPCSTVSGTANGMPHSWVLAQLDGEWYHMDPTWADSDELFGGRELLLCEYFVMTTEQLLLSHTPQADDLPLCTAEDADIFVRRGTRLAQWDTIALENLLREAAAAGEHALSLELTDPAAWSSARAALDNGEMLRLLRSVADTVPALDTRSLQYYPNDTRQVLHLILTYTQ
ncbi:MAG: hypothetical protein IJ412_02470 [Oscillospiraceae bacterium]|nr:hypothetical protein [Oscillospiraceae bacterium]